jgi:hypothetical protein
VDRPGAADATETVRRLDDLPPVARHAATRALEDGSYAVSRNGTRLVRLTLTVHGIVTVPVGIGIELRARGTA